jgi:hypothetical protein
MVFKSDVLSMKNGDCIHSHVAFSIKEKKRKFRTGLNRIDFILSSTINSTPSQGAV